MEQILGYVGEIIAKPSVEPVPTKMNQAMKTCKALVLMQLSLDAVPTSIILNSWFKTDILAPYQRQQTLNLLRACDKLANPAEEIQHNPATTTEREAVDRAAGNASKNWKHD